MSSKVVLFKRRDYCPHCDSLERTLKGIGVKYTTVFAEDIRPLFINTHRTVPQLYARGEWIGDNTKVHKLLSRVGPQELKRIIEGD